MNKITSTRAIALSLTQFEINEQLKKHEMPNGTQALINDALEELDQVHEVVKQQPAVEQLIKATVEYIYQQPARTANFRNYEGLIEALGGLGYRYCDGCDYYKPDVQERLDLPGGAALCTECDQATREEMKNQHDKMDADLKAEQSTLEVINQYRAANDLPPLNEEQAWQLFNDFLYGRTHEYNQHEADQKEG